MEVIDSKYEDIPEPYLVVKYCSGGELNKQKIENLSLIKKLEIFEFICEGVSHTHENKVIHRDIKPRNIFLTDRKTNTPVVGDFGICFFEEDEINDERLTAVREQVGAKSFRPPEAEFGIVEDVKPSFDVYSLGKLLYWLLSNGEILIREHYNHPKFDLRNENSEESFHILYTIFDKSICEKPEERYKSALEMLKDVREVVSFVKKDSRYLNCSIQQNCIFCRSGKYDFISSPSVSDKKFNFTKSLEYGINFGDYEGRSWHNHPSNYMSYPKVLIARCDNCGNIQQFQLDDNFGVAKNWKNIPKAE